MTMRSDVSPMQIEVLYFEDCHNHLTNVERMNTVLREECCNADVREVLVLAMCSFLPSGCAG